MSEDRDRLFERALARRLRAHGAAEPSCLDPETLAAYHERMLSPDEMSSAKSHIVSCLRCQEILTQLEATEEISARVEDDEEAAAVPLAATRSFLGGAHRPLPDVAHDVPLREAPKAVMPLPRKKAFAFRWAAPAGAIAAALLVWIGVRQAGVLRKPSSEATAVAERRRQLPATPPGPESGPTALPQEEKQKASSGSAGYLNEETQMTKGDAAPRPSLRDETKDAPPKLEREKTSPDGLAYSIRREGATGARGPSAAAAQAQANNAIQRGDQGAVAGAAQAVEPIPAFDKKAQLPPGRAESDALVAAKPAPLPQPPAPASRVGNLPSAGKNENGLKSNADVDTALRAVSKTSLDVRIASPGGRTMWSVGAGGQIFHSTDAGRTWLPQISGVAADLTGGSAPSDKVCWIAGAAGTLLRTTDGGLHWQQIVTPVRGDLSGVHARDAKHASIWDAPNRASYQTSDGGKTWKPSANE